MPYEWIIAPNSGPAAPMGPAANGAKPSTDSVIAEAHLWPYRSLPRKGFAGFIALTCTLLSVPLLSLIGLAALWVLLPFLILAVAGVWWALQRSYRDGEILETLRLSPDRIILIRSSRKHPPKVWDANPYWVRIRAHHTPVPDYLTLEGGPREVELGAFLAPEERRQLNAEITALLRLARAPKPDSSKP
jgi:uncharacterized membrane protein